MIVLAMFLAMLLLTEGSDSNHVYNPCADATVQKSDGFSFGIAFASRDSFFYNRTLQLSPCDRRLSLSSANSQIALFRPKVDEISLLTINTSSFSPVNISTLAFSANFYLIQFLLLFFILLMSRCANVRCFQLRVLKRYCQAFVTV